MKKFLLLLTFIISKGLIAAPIHDAAYKGNFDEVKRILSQNGGNDINAITEGGWTPLHEAADNGHAEIVEMLIRHSADVNAIDEDGRIPLHYAASWDYVEVVRILLEDPWCDHTIANDGGNTPEGIAILLGHKEIAEMLHNAPSVNEKVFSPGKGLQLFAARVANREGVYEEDYNELGTSVKHWITNIKKGKKPSYLKEDEASPSGYHSDDDVSSIATEDLEEELQQQNCSIQ